jgi:hypothetical protein
MIYPLCVFIRYLRTVEKTTGFLEQYAWPYANPALSNNQEYISASGSKIALSDSELKIGSKKEPNSTHSEVRFEFLFLRLLVPVHWPWVLSGRHIKAGGAAGLCIFVF